MTDIISALSDPELGAVHFTVRSLSYTLSQGVTAVTHTDRRAEGCIHPGTPETARLLPEEERHRESIVIYTVFPLSMGKNSGGPSWTAADRILYDGKAWKLVRLRPWQFWGYCQALAVLTDDAEPE